MNTSLVADKLELTELANKLFMYTDAKQWQQMLDEVFIGKVWFDMSSAGGGPAQEMTAAAICAAWKEGLSALDAVHHQAGHYLINVDGDKASIYGYSVAFHYKKAALKGQTRSFIGSYDLVAIRTDDGWRLSQFKYNLKYVDGNTTLD